MIKKLLTATLALAMLAACNNSTKQKKQTAPPPGAPAMKILAVYIKPTGEKQIDIVVREIQKTIKYDSLASADIIAIDTIYGYPISLPAKDSLGAAIKDSLGRPVFYQGYRMIHKDSVNWRVENVSVDSLVKH